MSGNQDDQDDQIDFTATGLHLSGLIESVKTIEDDGTRLRKGLRLYQQVVAAKRKIEQEIFNLDT